MYLAFAELLFKFTKGFLNEEQYWGQRLSFLLRFERSDLDPYIPGCGAAQKGAAQLNRVRRSSIGCGAASGCGAAQQGAAQLNRVRRSSKGAAQLN
jgi:hypothetical protein